MHGCVGKGKSMCSARHGGGVRREGETSRACPAPVDDLCLGEEEQADEPQQHDGPPHHHVEHEEEQRVLGGFRQHAGAVVRVAVRRQDVEDLGTRRRSGSSQRGAQR